MARRRWILLALLALGAFLARAPAVPRLLPHRPEPDSYFVQLAQDWRGDRSLVDHVDYAERYPTLLAHTLALLPWPGDANGTHVERLRAAAGPYLVGRWLVLVLSLLALPATWAVARRLAGEAAAWLACGLVATSGMMTLFSTQARPHAAHAALAMCAVWACMRYAERPVVARALLAAGASALAAACLQIGLATLPVLALAGWLAQAPAERRTPLLRAARALGWPLAAGAAAIWAYPFGPALLGGTVRLGGSGAHPIDWRGTNFDGLPWITRWTWWHEPVLVLLVAVALVAALVRARGSWNALRTNRDLQLACAHALPYILLVASLNRVRERFAIPFVPWLAIFAAAFVTRAVGRGRPRALAAVAAVLLALPAGLAARYALVASRPDSYELAADRVAADPDARAGTIVATPALFLPVAYESAALDAALADGAGRAAVWPMFQGAHRATSSAEPEIRLHALPAALATADEAQVAAWLDELAPRHALIERAGRNRGAAGTRALVRLVEARGELVWASTGETPDGEERGLLLYQDVQAFAPRLVATERLGARVELWRLRD